MEGSEEAEAFKRREFIRMHSSTIAKVEFFRHIIAAVEKGRLRVASRGIFVRVDQLLEGRWARVVALIASVLGVGAIILQATSWIEAFMRH